MTTFGFIDHHKHILFTVEAVTIKEAKQRILDAGYAEPISVYPVTPLSKDSGTGKSHFAEAAKLARAGREPQVGDKIRKTPEELEASRQARAERDK